MTLDAETQGRLTLLNTVLIGLNTLILGALLLGGESHEDPGPPRPDLDEGAIRPAALPTAATEGAPGPSLGGPSDRPEPLSADPVENFVLSTVRPLASAARDMGQEVALPTEAEQAACVTSGDLASAACVAIFDTMKEGYARFGMPFPTAPEITMPVEPGGAPTAGGAPAPAAGAGAQVLQVYLDTLQERLRTAAEEAGEVPADLLPAPELVAAAVATGDPRSPESGVVLDHLRERYGQYGLRFTEPYVSGGATPAPGGAAAPASAPAPGDGAEAERELLQSYLDHMIQRLERAALDQGKDPAMLKPSAEAVAAAVGSASAASPETQAVLTTLRAGYANLDLAFTEPPM